MGYFHGYKGYRYIKEPFNELNFRDFDEIIAINAFDCQVKTLFYPHLMFLETALKSRTLEVCINSCSENFAEIYDKILDDHRRFAPSDKEYKKAFKRRLDLRNEIFSTISRCYQSDLKMVQHYHHKNEPVPIWAIFEIISLGQFGVFLQTMNNPSRLKLSEDIGLLDTSIDSDGHLLHELVFFMKGLRNAVAHNSVVFDCRFMKDNPPARIKRFMHKETSLANVTFEYIDDYLALITVLLMKLGVAKTERKKLIRQFGEIVDALHSQIPISMFNRILGTSTRNKLQTIFNL
ncbi:MAG: Abi family protein [Bacillota bacterium]|nr:Abi family protein [Bacillota bacterium]